MNYSFAGVAFFGFIFSIGCGILALLNGPRSLLHRIFFLAALCIALFNLGQFLALVSSTSEVAEICLRYGFSLFAISASFMFHFIYLFTKKKNPAIRSIFYPLLYGPALLIAYLSVGTDLFYLGTRKTIFGFVHIYGNYYYWFAAYVALIFLADLYLLIKARPGVKIEREKKQYAWMFGGVLSSTFIGIIFQIVLPRLGVYYVNIIPTASLFLYAGFTVAITRHWLLVVTPAFLAQNIIDTMAGMLFFTDPEDVIRMVNKSFTEKLGYRPEDVIGLTCGKLQADMAQYEALCVDIAVKGEVKAGGAKILKKDKSVLPVTVRASAVRDSFGEKVGQIYIMLDITGEQRQADEQKQTIAELTKTKEHMLSILEDATQARDEARKKTEEINKLYEDLKGVDKMKTEFLSVISHELRTPITPIKGFTAMLLANQMGPLTDAQRNAITVVQKEGEHLLELIDSVLEVSRLERGKAIDIVKEPVLIRSLIKELVDVFYPQYQERNIAIEVDIPENFPTIMGDAAKLRRVFTNLVGNSMKFTPQGGKIKISGVKKEGFIEMQVADTGIGISKENIGKLFQRFYQVDSSYSRSAGGVGLGLSIARGIVDAHGGKMWAESDGLGKGTRMIFTLPLGA